MDWDLGTAYGHLRPWWAGYASGEYSFWEMDALMGDRRVEDMRLRHREVLESARWGKPGSFRISHNTGERIANTQLPPRRVWDLYSNRVVPFSVLRCGVTSVPDNVWAVSHSWVKPAERRDVWTTVNGKHWPVPLPTDVSLDQVCIELLNMGAEYVFLDVLCLRQQGDEAMEEIRQEEWELDVPTLGYVYRHNRYQTVVVYFNALGRPFCPRRDLLDSPLHWFNRAWTLQETSINWLPGGLTASSCAEWDGNHFMARMREAQMDLCLHTLPAETPQFAGILRAMRRRTGYADKKPYDRVAALAYLLPGHTPEVYVERWANAEEAWSALVRSLTGHERLDLLLHDPSYDTGDAREGEKVDSPRKRSWSFSWPDLSRRTGSQTAPTHPTLYERDGNVFAAILAQPEPEPQPLDTLFGDEEVAVSPSVRSSWRPTWSDMMKTSYLVGASGRNYSEDDILREHAIASAGSRTAASNFVRR